MAGNRSNTDDQNPSKQRLRLWLNLLRSTRLIEAQLRENLRREYAVTLPRFDVMAALHRNPDGLLMSQLSRFLMVSNGNVTGIIDRLVQDGLVSRAKRQGDRRTSIVQLTARGRDEFNIMAGEHETWVNALFDDFSTDDIGQMSSTLNRFLASKGNLS